jgi:hypothetical protein
MYLPVQPEVKAIANEHLASMSARGFGCTVEEAVRKATEIVNYHKNNLDKKR